MSDQAGGLGVSPKPLFPPSSEGNGHGAALLAAPRGQTVAEVYQYLRRQILEGAYPPGQRVTQDALLQTLRVSRTPLREALRLLEADGLVESQPHRGVVIAGTSLRTAEESYAIRLVLERTAILGAVEAVGPAECAAMHRSLEQMARSVDRQRDFQQAHLAFHLVCVERYDNGILRRTVLDLYQQLLRYQLYYMSRPRAPEEFLSVDALLLAAIEARQPRRAQRLLDFHLLDVAIGMLCEIEPDYRFGPLLQAAEACGIALGIAPDAAVRRPARFAWREGAASAPPLRTSNLSYEPLTS